MSTASIVFCSAATSMLFDKLVVEMTHLVVPETYGINYKGDI
jgi:hypothetical protein